MLRILVVLCCLLMTFSVQAQSDLELVFEADDFIGGMPVNQSGVIRFTVFNHGPDDFIASSSPIKLLGAYDYVVSDGNPFRFFSDFNSNDADCSLAVEHFDPPPPVNNYGLFMWGMIYKIIPTQSSITCEFEVSLQEVALLDMQWQIGHNDDPNIDNNTQQFTFRGLAASVPVNNIWALIVLIAFVLTYGWRSRHYFSP